MTARALGHLQGRLRASQGFTVIEVVVAMMILAITTLAVFGVVDAASRNDYRATQSQVVNDLLQQEMEKIKQIPYSRVALTSLPAHSTDPSNPNYRVSGTQFNVNKTGTASNWPLTYSGGHASDTGQSVSCPSPGCGIDPGPTPFTNGNVSGNIYRYVVWQPETSCLNCAHNTSSDMYNGSRVPWVKHVVVAVTLNQTGAGGIRPYQEIQGDIGSPDEGQGTGTTCQGSCTNNPTPWTFWLTDTPCGPTDPQSRQPITGDHLAHDTLGVCSKGMTTGPPGLLGGNAGAPDLMFTQPTPCADPDCTGAQPKCDYSTDVEPVGDPSPDPSDCSDTDSSGGVDKGLQLRTPTNLVNGGSGCLTDLSGISSLLSLGTDPEWYMHKWVTNKIPSGLNNIVLTGNGEVDLWTQTIGNAAYNGRICVWLFTRTLNGLGAPVDTFAVSTDAHDECTTSRTLTLSLTYFQCSMSAWPQGPNWTEIHIPLHFAALTLPPNYRLGLAIAVERSGTTPGGGLQFLYDHPTYDSRLVLNTQSVVPSGLPGWP